MSSKGNIRIGRWEFESSPLNGVLLVLAGAVLLFLFLLLPLDLLLPQRGYVKEPPRLNADHTFTLPTVEFHHDHADAIAVAGIAAVVLTLYGFFVSRLKTNPPLYKTICCVVPGSLLLKGWDAINGETGERQRQQVAGQTDQNEPSGLTTPVTAPPHWKRQLATVIDLILCLIVFCIALLFAIYVAATKVSAQTKFDEYASWAFLFAASVSVLFFWFYHAYLECKATTLGKLAVGLVVQSPAGSRISLGRATFRFVAKLAVLGLVLIVIGIPLMLLGTYIMPQWTPGASGKEFAASYHAIELIYDLVVVIIMSFAILRLGRKGSQTLYDRFSGTYVNQARPVNRG